MEEIFRAVPGFVSAVAFGRSNHDLLVSGDSGGAASRLRVWRIGPHPRLLHSISVHGLVTWATWSPDGSTIAATAAVSGSKGFVREWNARTGRTIGTSFVKGGYPVNVAFAPHGTTVAISGLNFGAEVVDPAKGAVVSKTGPLDSYTFAVSFSPDGTKLATTDWNGTLDIWNRATGKAIGAPIPDPDQDPGVSVDWSPDGNTIALTDNSNTLRLFDVSTRSEIGPPFQLASGRDNQYPYASYMPDGTHIVVSDDTGRTWVVPVTLRAWEAAACRIANRNLTHAEWHEFLPGRPYRRLCP